MVFSKKYAKLKLLMLIPPLKLVVCFSIPDNIVLTIKHFSDNISIFSAFYDANISADELHKDLQKYLNVSMDGKCHSILT